MDYLNDDYDERDERDSDAGYTYPKTCDCTRETDKALLMFDGTEEFWVPRSQIHDDSEVYEANTDGKLVVTEWFAKKREWL